jgi:hypothetical protein
LGNACLGLPNGGGCHEVDTSWLIVAHT